MNYTVKQQQAIESVDNNLQPISCGGSCKTQVDFKYILSILKSNQKIKPKNIIYFNYTEKATAELKSTIPKLSWQQPMNRYLSLSKY